MSQAAGPYENVPPPFQRSGARPDRLVHMIPDELAEKVPEHSLFAFPKTEKPSDGFIEVSAKRFANAINRTSWYLESLLGKNPEGFPAIAYMGSNDIRYFILMFGAIKAGYKMLFLSPRNTVAGHINVLEKSDCHYFLTAEGTQIEHILNERTMHTATVPELAELLDDTEVEVYPYTKTYAEARKDPGLVLHTTGSTGLPKPITWKLEILSTYEAWRLIPSIDDYISTTEVYQEARRAYNAMPYFHTSGLNTGITMSLLLGVTTVLGSANVATHAAYADEMHKHAGVDASIGPPSIYEELSRTPESLERINNFHYVLVCGAPISGTAGDVISKHTRLISNFGATETACLPRLAPAIEDWAYYYWHPTHSGIELREYTEGLYELFLVKDPKLEHYQGIFSTFPDIQEYSMSDLYTKHPDPAKGFLYKWRGRVDDVIVLSNGEKLAPALMEASIMSSRLVKGAMVVGRGKFQPAVLIDLGEPAPETPAGRHELKKELAPAIAEANKHAPAHGKLDEYHILFVDPERPIRYLGQGKIQRHQTYMLYEKDIEELYEAADNFDEPSDEANDLPKIDFADRTSIKKWLHDVILRIAEIPHDLNDADPFFESGLDSLHVIRLIRELKFQAKEAGGKLTPDALSPGVVYANSSLCELSHFLFREAGLAPESELEKDKQEEATGNPKQAYMEQLLEDFVESLPYQKHPRPAPITQGTTVLLTGSTGSLGSYLLNELYNDPNVDHVICLNRSVAAAEKHNVSGPERGLAAIDNPTRVEFFTSNLAEENLGLEEDVYERIVDTVTHIIHCQWPVNFNWAISSFKPYIAGVRNLANLAATSDKNAFILFVSSIAAVGSFKGAGSVPESPINDLSSAANMGYGQSKLIAESLLDRAADRSAVRSACCRVGIVAGPIEKQMGMWNKHEYIPSIIVSSAHLGVFPETFPSRDHIDWLPVDKLSKILVEILASASGRRPSVDVRLAREVPAGPPTGTGLHSKTYHVVNPHAASWHDNLAAELVAAYPAGTVRPVAFEEWLEKLKASAEAAENDDNVDVENNPAIRLVDFYAKAAGSDEAGRRILSTNASEQASKTLRDLGPLSREWVENWMAQWKITSKAAEAGPAAPAV